MKNRYLHPNLTLLIFFPPVRDNKKAMKKTQTYIFASSDKELVSCPLYGYLFKIFPKCSPNITKLKFTYRDQELTYTEIFLTMVLLFDCLSKAKGKKFPGISSCAYLSYMPSSWVVQ